jgi:hypothetical protein
VIMDRADAADQKQMHIEWTGEITINSDGSLSGSMPGGLTANGVDWGANGTIVGKWDLYAPMGVEIGGNAERTDGGLTLHIKQTMTGSQIERLNIDTQGDRAALEAEIRSELPGWIKDAMTNLLLPAGSSALYGSVEAGGYSGSANLFPVR